MIPAQTMKRILPLAAFSPEGCWEWKGTHSGGYSKLTMTGYSPNVHRVMYEWMIGPIPAGLELDHLCRNRGCIRPSHLEAVTHAENLLRSPSTWGGSNRRKTHCPRGHPYSGENLYVSPRGARVCRTCRRYRESMNRKSTAE